jgi:hypothetical protein
LVRVTVLVSVPEICVLVPVSVEVVVLVKEWVIVSVAVAV